MHKRLERGTFVFPQQVTNDSTCVAIDVHELAMLLEGLELGRGRASARWEPAAYARAAM